jgi:hypothetical protein
MRRARGLLVSAVLWICLSGTASALQSVRLQATLTPERLGQGTTVGFGFQISSPAEQVPSPVSGVEISYPVDLDFALSELGLATCSTQTLAAAGPTGCPADSLMGYGTAIAEIQIGPEIEQEAVQITIVRTTEQEGHLALLIYADGQMPISTQIVFPGLILPAPAPFGGLLNMSVPPVPSLPDAADVAVVQFHSTLGPLHLRYQEHIHGRVVEYEPKGVPLPDVCPRGGFLFSARFAFQDGSHSKAAATVPCPAVQPHRGR